jgi:hypothetical protein
MGNESMEEPGSVRVELVYFEGCPHWRTALEHLENALQQAGRSDSIKLQLVTNKSEAEQHSMADSPTILIDGRDPFLGGGPAWGCRLYPGGDGSPGAPSVASLVEVLM